MESTGIKISTEITKEQADIINECETEPIKSQLESFAKYLNLPWDNLEEFQKAVEAHEKNFRENLKKKAHKTVDAEPKISNAQDDEPKITTAKDLQEKSNNTEYNEPKLSPIESYLRNVFHIFNRPITELSTGEFQRRLRFKPIMIDIAVHLLNQKGWHDMKDKFGDPANNYNTFNFLEELAARLLNLNFVFPKRVPDTNIGSKTLNSNYLRLLPNINDMKITPIDQDKAEFLQGRFELYFYCLNPQIVFRNRAATTMFGREDEYNGEKEKDDDALKRTSAVEAQISVDLFLRMEFFIAKMFSFSIFPNISEAAGAVLRIETESFVGEDLWSESKDEFIDMFGNRDKDKYEENPLLRIASNTFNQSLSGTSGKPDISVMLEQLDGYFHGLSLFEVEKDGTLAESASNYLNSLTAKISSARSDFIESNTGPVDDIIIGSSADINSPINASSANEKKRNAPDKGFSEETPRKRKKTMNRNAGPIHDDLVQCMCYGKITGSPFCLLTNGDDFITLQVTNFYGKVKGVLKDPKKMNLFDYWDVSVFGRVDIKYSVMTLIGSIVMSEFRHFMNDDVRLTNSQIRNFHLTYGSSKMKKNIDKARYLISRKVFYTLMNSKVDVNDKPKLEWGESADLPNFGSTLDPLIEKIERLTQESLNQYLDNISSDISKSEEWKLFDDSVLQNPLKILDSSCFKASETLQNESWCTQVGSTTMKGRFETGKSVLKIYDINRMLINPSMEIQFIDGSVKTANFHTVLKTSFELWLKEINSYRILHGKDYIARLISSGFMYIPDLKLSSLTKDILLYENYLDSDERSVKTEAPFLITEHIEMVSEEQMVNIDFKRLRKDAEDDLKDMHRQGVFHCDINYRNIIIKKCNSGTYKVVFIDFGESDILVPTNEVGNVYFQDLEERSSHDLESLENAITHYEKRTKTLIAKQKNSTQA